MIPIFFRRVAERILSLHATSPRDLRAATVLLPNYHCAQPLAEAFAAAAGTTVLLPRMLTLTDWAQEVPLGTSPLPDTRRIASLYRALRDRGWFGDADLWGLARELLSLIDELTRHRVILPDSPQAFAEQLAAAYRARSGQSLQFEARVVHELWYAMVQDPAADAVQDWQRRLARLAQHVEGPLYVLQTCEPEITERHFFAVCRERVPVELFDLRELCRDEAGCALLSRALQQGEAGTDLRREAEVLQAQPAGHLGERLRLFGAHGLEQEAQAADVQIRQWLIEGRRSIAVVVQDRLVARRARALLERAGVMVRDETGWTLATLSVSTVLMRWLETVQGDFYYQDALDLLKSPFLFAEAPAAERKQVAYLFEQLVRRHGVVTHLDNFIELAEREASPLVQPLARLRQAMSALPRKSVPLADWLRALADSLEILGVSQGWAQDAAGQQLQGLFAQWTEELDEDSTRCSFAEWRRWLAQQLDLHTFRDGMVDSPVLFTHLAATRWRHFDAVLLLGCDGAHLPAPTQAGQWFNDAVRTSLGLPPSTVRQAMVRDDLLALLAMNETVLASWQESRNGEPNLLSPYLEMLRAMHLLAYREDLAAHTLGGLLAQARVRGEGFVLPSAAAMPAPVVSPELIPRHISPSAYNSLVACPYQFHVRHQLRLNELDEVREALDKRDYGTWVHEVLQRFHEAYPELTGQMRDMLETELRRISEGVFALALAHDYLAHAWLLRWQEQIPAYLDWQLATEREGWRYAAAEQPFSVEISAHLTLRGRIDRIDRQNGQTRVLDYKTQAPAALKNRLKEAGEDVQLACYAYACGAPSAAFVALDGVEAVTPSQDLDELARLNIERLRGVFERLHEGAAMPAHGAESACGHCEMRGLCRQGTWTVEGGMAESGADHG